MRFDVRGRRSPDGPVWDISDIAAYFRVQTKAAQRMAARPDFPRPIGNQQRYRRWRSEEVQAYTPQPLSNARDVAARGDSAVVVRQIAFGRARS